MSEPTFLRRKLGTKLRRLREQAGLTLADAAPKLDKKRSALHRVETGETKADVHLVRSMMDLYDCYEPGLLDETRQALKPPWYWTYGIRKMGYVDAETEAVLVREFTMIDIPGLLQTEDYMRAQFAGGISRTELEMARDIKVRCIRQDRLINADRPLEHVVVVHEIALHRELGSRDVMREQLRHLVEMSRLPNVTLQVVPLRQGTHHVPNGPFVLLSFPDPDDPDLLHVEYPTGSLQSEEPIQVQAARLLFDQVHTVALSPGDSAVPIQRLAAELYGPDM
ncbi:transcriptional regulator with XRE-family HTH domain [Kibdelosporangium banguiense]|uniref:Transcriptional regulator with XRE-family HTH domain n=1 Tax=Kibdelosporangium banguiense TaxID=1365924 RepID=A0ABS4U4D5_9PSEU|nr:helix-turn-helix transcriptional regulator [Kibdelosporangium banguiense]MBP2331061.1 transcriptional regulator with XRE-family HTH domain [Kibdelosporangium banguiense]